MQVGKVQCDECKFLGDLVPDEVYKTKLSTPSGWALVHSTVRIAGERQLTPENKKKLKAHICTMFPPMHLCPRCVFKDVVNVSRMLGCKAG